MSATSEEKRSVKTESAISATSQAGTEGQHNACNLKLRIYPEKVKAPLSFTTSEAMMVT